jgi:hypothetical protein
MQQWSEVVQANDLFQKKIFSMADIQSDFKPIQTRRTFEEVIAQVRAMLFDGSLKPGDRLPPERELSQKVAGWLESELY